MKKRNLLVIGAAAGLCVASAALLTGSMGIYAEKSGTAEWDLRQGESETEDALALALSETEETGEDVSIPESKLKEQWERMYAEYESSEYGQKMIAQAKTFETDETEAAARTDNPKEMLITLENAKLGIANAGVMALKEIARIHSGDALENLRITWLLFSADQPEDSRHQFQWEIDLENGYDETDGRSRSYTVHIDAVSGEFLQFQTFRPYQEGVDYSRVSWTDEQIAENAKTLITKYALADEGDLDWENAEIFNSSDELDSLEEEFKEGACFGLGNTVIFSKGGKRYFYLNMDWETGELYTYMWY